jgi:TonB family protein
MNMPMMTPDLWLSLLMDGALKGSVILAAAALATRLLRKQAAALRHLVWAAAVVSLLALPAASRLMPAWQSGVYEKVASLAAGPVAQPSPEAAIENPMAVAAGGVQKKSGGRTWILIAIWAVGFGTAVLTLVAGTFRLWRLVRGATPLFVRRWVLLSAEISGALGLRRPVRLLVSRRATMPVTWGFLRPRVMLPQGAEAWTGERMRIVLSHELAHIRRHDWLMQILAEVGRALYWFNPLVWMGCSRLRQESEYACDDAVLNSGVEGSEYAEHLLELARSLRNSERAWAVALAMARPTNLERRFLAMLNPRLKRRAVTKRAVLVTLLAAICLTAPLAALQVSTQNPSGKFSGTVYDATGGVIPNATVILSNPEANTKDMTTTSATGYFEFTGLPAGRYVMQTLAKGFARKEMPDVVLRPNEDRSQNVTLEIGRASERVNVVASSPAKAVTTEKQPVRVRVGGGVQQAKLVKMPRPSYPPHLKAAGVEGSVLLLAVVGKDGKLSSLQVMNSQVDPDLAKSAVEAVSQWEYQPTLLNGNPVEIVTDIEVNYKLSK